MEIDPAAAASCAVAWNDVSPASALTVGRGTERRRRSLLRGAVTH
jgi:hypothetical protein